jgi:hypothetical protein
MPRRSGNSALKIGGFQSKVATVLDRLGKLGEAHKKVSVLQKRWVPPELSAPISAQR